MTLTLNLSPELERRLAGEAEQQGVSVDEYALRILERRPSPPERRAALLTLLQSWIDEGRAEEYGEEASDEFLKTLDENRDSYRRLFPPELKGVTW